MKKIKLTRGQFAIVDDEDYPRLSQFKWHAHFERATGKFTAARHLGYVDGKSKSRSLQEEILGKRANLTIDHVNLDSLDNQKENLRWATRTQQAQNRRPRKNKSGYKGVHWYRDRFRASITLPGHKRISLGHFKTAEEAGRAYDQAATKYFGEFARPL